MIDRTSAKAWLRVTTTSEDTLIDGLVSAAVANIEAMTGKNMSSKAFTQELSGFPIDYPYAIRFRRGPVTAITSIAYDPDDGSAEATVTDFRLAEGYGAAFNGTLQPDYGESWPSALAGAGTVRITGTAGYGDGEAPDLDTAAHMMVAHWYQNREAASSANLSEIPLGVRALLGPYMPVGLA